MNPLALLRLLPLRDWAYFGGLLAIAGFIGWAVHHERAVGAAKVEAVRQAEHAQAAAVAASAAASAAIESARRLAAQKESDHEADRFRAQALADARAVLPAGDRLLQRVAAAGADSCRVSGDPAAVAPGAPASAAGDLRADVLRRVVEAAGQLAAAGDAARGAGADAERQYDSLTP